jgi:hypothetical protein
LPLANLLPVFGANQQFSMGLSRNPNLPGATGFSGQVCLDLEADSQLGCFEFKDLPDSQADQVRWTYDSSEFPRNGSLCLRSRSDGAIFANDIEFTWTWRDMLAVRANQLRRALGENPPPSPAIRYGDWLAVRGCQATDGAIALTLEALQDWIPPFAARLQVYKRGRWRDGPVLPIGPPGTAWRAGERRTVELPREEPLPPDQVGIAIVTDVPWHSSLLPMAGAPASRPFPTLADLLRAP